MNRFSIWTYLLIVFVLVFGALYSLPNLYPANPSIQIAYSQSGQAADTDLLNKVNTLISENGINAKDVSLKENNIVAQFSDLDAQLKAKTVIQRALLDQVIVALNLEPTTPEWLANLGAGPLKLGLDLSGGVHFLLEVDIANALQNRLENTLSSYRKRFADDGIAYSQSQIEDQSLVFKFNDSENYSSALAILNDENLTATGNLYDLSPAVASNTIRFKFSDTAIKELRDYAVGQNLVTLRNRVNELGVSEPVVQRQGSSRIVVELPGVQDTAAAKKIIGKTANLEFRMEAKPEASRLRKERFDYKNAPGLDALLERSVIVAGESVTNASTGFDENGFAQVNITLDLQGGRAMQKATTGNIGRRLAVLFVEEKTLSELKKDEEGKEYIEQTSYIDKKIISLATVQAVLGTSFRITGVGTPQEASELALLLRAGALAAPMKFVEERTVGPSLGKENIKLGIQSMIIGFLAVVAFMLFYYRWFGFAANIALAANIVLITGVMSLLGATLTLPGIAGIVLTVGMAVDANVLIFSRIREELQAGSDPQIAIKEGFGRAFTTIFDANITTLIAAVVLYAIGTGPIKGFAITLSIGIVTSMFTAILGTRAIVNLMYGNKRLQELKI
ncbi:MAG: protein translocase subunit SecD [Gammaproteobacteria bacterium]|jgi:preprotein translocase subunit SecD